MKTDAPRTIYLKDYKPYPYDVRHMDLNFDIRDGYTLVKSLIQFEAKEGVRDDLFLNGEELELVELKLNDRVLVPKKDYKLGDLGLTIPCPADKTFLLEVTTQIGPEENTRLEGLYKSGDTYCTQCEAEGFRTITYYPDRPDVMTTFTTRIEADKRLYPVLLGNGNRLNAGDLDGGRHYAVWDDPYPKPCYLFALVAGNLVHIHDTFTTSSGRNVDLYIYVRPGDEGQCAHAMDSLKKAMKWDEDVYGLEYDLDLFNIVAVSDFNMGAMENKSLNIFNTALVLAQQETATDGDYIRVESVIAHEYFHNWSGNRVTCRDWFQLSLKEGLTVFRDQEFSSDLNSRPVQRIDDVSHLRRFQFPEDSSPLAHSIRPDNYIEINNFYTMTVYEKGAEVIRMLRTILGETNYRKGTDLYFSLYDGQAVTCEDFVNCMETAGGIDLSRFRLWYEQAGTPEVTFEGRYDPKNKIYEIELSQTLPDTPGQKNKKPMHMPVAVGLLNDQGEDIAFRTFHLKEEKQKFKIENVHSKPVPSVLRDFSAPVKLHCSLSDEELAFLMVHDTDGFNRWEAGQNLALKAIESGAHDLFLDAIGKLLKNIEDPALTSRAITLPSVGFIGQTRGENIDPVAIYKAQQALMAAMKSAHRKALEVMYEDLSAEKEFSITPEAMGRRALRNTILEILTCTHGTGCRSRAATHYKGATNMTDRVAALSVLASIDCPESKEAFSDFYDRFNGYPLVVDKYFALQAGAVRDDIMGVLSKLREHIDFNIKNPNRVRSLYSSFTMMNPVSFHAADGSGYEFLTKAVIELNTINPQIAARLVTPLREWRRYTPDRQKLMQKNLQKILDQPKLSPNVYEIVSKSLK